MIIIRRFHWELFLLFFIIIWITYIVYFLANTIYEAGMTKLNLKTDLQLAYMKLEELEKDNLELRHKLKAAEDRYENLLNKGPSMEYELLRRRISVEVKEMWLFVNASLESAIKTDNISADLSAVLKLNLEDTKHRQMSILTQLKHLALEDGHDIWRQKEAKALSDLMQARLHSLQNPLDCTKAKKLVCNMKDACGFGCQLHHITYCLIMAYATERMFVLESQKWQYHKAGFEDAFQPLSDTCRSLDLSGRKNWPSDKDTLVIKLDAIDYLKDHKPEYLPPTIPKDLADRIMRIHGDPKVWWISQFLKYLIRPQNNLATLLKARETSENFQHPIVGVHIRRTDKVKLEAAFHSVDEYMKHVEEFYQELALREGHRTQVKKVYMASDDPSVFEECREKYPDYVFLGNVTVAENAQTRGNSLQGILTDIHMLSLTDHLVCTFSSQVCRMAYEMMQLLNNDASDRFTSLDDLWYFGGGNGHTQVAVMDHKPRKDSEIELREGDVIRVAGNHWNGFSKGRNLRTGNTGLYPGYKTREKVRVAEFPGYPQNEL